MIVFAEWVCTKAFSLNAGHLNRLPHILYETKITWDRQITDQTYCINCILPEFAKNGIFITFYNIFGWHSLIEAFWLHILTFITESIQWIRNFYKILEFSPKTHHLHFSFNGQASTCWTEPTIIQIFIHRKDVSF